MHKIIVIVTRRALQKCNIILPLKTSATDNNADKMAEAIFMKNKRGSV